MDVIVLVNFGLVTKDVEKYNFLTRNQVFIFRALYTSDKRSSDFVKNFWRMNPNRD